MTRLALLIFLSSCLTGGDYIVRFNIDSHSYGWYVIRLRVNHDAETKNMVDVNFKTDERFKRIELKQTEGIIFQVYDENGKDISQPMGFVGMGATDEPHRYFKFYYPRPGEASYLVHNTDSTNEGYYRIKKRGSEFLDSLRHTSEW